MSPVLEIADLHVDFGARIAAVRGVSLTVERGETHCVVGESGCGKSVTALAVMNLLARGGRRHAGSLRFHDTDLLALPERRMANLRGDRLAMIFQEPMTSLNPAYTIGSQMTEVYRRHRGGSRAHARDRAVEMLARVGISAPGNRLGQYPHQLSGGLRQRVMIATALLCEPELLIADEPTTALDVTLQAQILHLLAELQRELGLALLLITHDLGVVARVAHKVSVMYAGEVVETASAAQLFARPLHPYTQGLLASVPVPGKIGRDQRLGGIPGVVPRIASGFSGCGFRDRCSCAEPSCAIIVPRQEADPGHVYSCRLGPHEAASPSQFDTPSLPGAAMAAARGRAAPTQRSEEPLIHVKHLSKHFDLPGPLFGPRRGLTAVDAVSLRVPASGVLGVVGESGCGKSTLAKLILGLMTPSSGEVRISGQSVATLDRRERAQLMQPVFQDPVSSLNPRRRVRDVVALPLVALGGLARSAIAGRVAAQLTRVGLSPDMAERFPHELSGGQRQRVAIARALVLEPRIVVCDEPTSALDVSVQAQILNLLSDLRRDLGLTYVFISHNLAVVEHIATEVAVMYLGRVVEQRPVEPLFRDPRHPYTKALLASVLTPEPGLGVPEMGLGEAGPDPANPPPGCRFHPRCALAVERCRVEAPELRAMGGGLVACHLAAG